MPRTRTLVLLLTALTLLAVAGCGGDDEPSSSGDGGGGDAPAASKFDAALEEQYKGTYESPPSESPKPEAGKKVWLVSCGQTIATCAVAIDGAEQAGKAVGWDTTIFDTKADPAEATKGIRQAIAAKADGIFVYFFDCSFMPQALQDAKDAGIPVVAAESYDCNEGGADGPQLFTAQVTYVGGESYAEWVKGWGKASGEYIVSKLKGKGEILIFGQDASPAYLDVEAGFKEAVDGCPGCKLESVLFTFQDLIEGVQDETGRELLKRPGVDAVVGAYEGITLAGVSAGLQAAQFDGIFTIGEGGEGSMDLVRQGQATGGVGIPVGWEGYAGIDTLNRLFHGEEPQGSGIGFQAFDTEHNLPESGGFQAPIDYAAAYKKAWGVE